MFIFQFLPSNIYTRLVKRRIALRLKIRQSRKKIRNPWPRPGLEELGVCPPRPKSCRDGIMLISRRARARRNSKQNRMFQTEMIKKRWAVCLQCGCGRERYIAQNA